MARAESKMIMGYLPIESQHHPAILSLVAPATPAVKLLDPFAGDGLFLDVAAKAWKVTPYANELDGERADKCIQRFGPKQAVRCDVERLLASNNVFGAAWLNPPYDHDKTAKASKQVEFAYLRHSWKWLQDGGLALLRERRPTGQFLPQLAGGQPDKRREFIAESVTEIVIYTERCRRSTQQLTKLAPIPLTAFSILEYGL